MIYTVPAAWTKSGPLSVAQKTDKLGRYISEARHWKRGETLGLFKKVVGFALILQGLFGAAIFTSIPGLSGLAVLEVLLLIVGIVVITRK